MINEIKVMKVFKFDVFLINFKYLYVFSVSISIVIVNLILIVFIFECIYDDCVYVFDFLCMI